MTNHVVGSDFAMPAKTIEENRQSSRDAARNLARLIERQLGFDHGHIDQVALRLFIIAHWKKVSTLAHLIHGDPD